MNPSINLDFRSKLKKFYRYSEIFSFRRALTKTLGRSDVKLTLLKKRYLFNKPHIFLIGCGQFQFSTIAYFLSKSLTNKIYGCYDINFEKARLLSFYYNTKSIPRNWETILDNEKVNLVYIASNHHSHSEYAIRCLKKGKDVYSEKPLVVSWSQFDSLFEEIYKSNSKFYAGYNRPFSKAIRTVRNQFKGYKQNLPIFTLSFFINGHKIPESHWYRNAKEGTRVCGNIGHWIDLSIHILNWRSQLPNSLDLNITFSNVDEPDDNLAITIISDLGDLINIIITSRSEPFEGISESINLQLGDIIARIDDFRSLKLWTGNSLIRKNYTPKDVGHEDAVLQPFKRIQLRSIHELKLGTYIMLMVKDMVINRTEKKTIDLRLL